MKIFRGLVLAVVSAILVIVAIPNIATADAGELTDKEYWISLMEQYSQINSDNILTSQDVKDSMKGKDWWNILPPEEQDRIANRDAWASVNRAWDKILGSHNPIVPMHLFQRPGPRCQFEGLDGFCVGVKGVWGIVYWQGSHRTRTIASDLIVSNKGTTVIISENTTINQGSPCLCSYFEIGYDYEISIDPQTGWPISATEVMTFTPGFMSFSKPIEILTNGNILTVTEISNGKILK